MKKRKFQIYMIIVALAIFVIPFIINESYKMDTRYTTMWGAADVLNYYGTLLGAIVSVVLLIITIRYNRKQIIFEKTLQQDQEKWSSIEQMVNQTLDDINPMHMQKLISDTAENLRFELLYMRIASHTVTARATVDKLLLLADEHESQPFADLVGKIDDAMQDYSKISKMYCDLYWEALGKFQALQIMKNGESTSDLTAICTLKTFSDFVEQSQEISNQLMNIYETKYKPLIPYKKL